MYKVTLLSALSRDPCDLSLRIQLNLFPFREIAFLTITLFSLRSLVLIIKDNISMLKNACFRKNILYFHSISLLEMPTTNGIYFVFRLCY